MTVAPIEADLGIDELSSPSRSADTAIRRILTVFRRRPLAFAGLVWLVLMVLMAIFAPIIAPYGPTQQDLNYIFAGPSLHHLLGADQLGRDTLSRVIYAARVALPAAALGVGVAAGLGIPLGLVVGYAGKKVDWVAMRLVDASFSLPHLIMAIAVVGALGPSLVHAMVTLGVFASTGFARLTRGMVLSAREDLYVDAAKVSGESASRILTHEVFPNVAGPLVVQTTLAFAHMMLGEAGLSFIGLGVQPPQASWGSMLNDARTYINHDAFLAVPPGFFLLVTVLAFQVTGDSLRDALVQGRQGLPGRRRRQTPVTTRPVVSFPPEPAVSPGASSDAVLEVEHLTVSIDTEGEQVPVVSDVSFRVEQGKTLGLVGESGCGKSITALSISGLLPPTINPTAGRILLGGENLLSFSDKEMDKVRGNRIGMIFQDPSGSLDPAYTIGYQLSEPLRIHRHLSRRDAWQEAIGLLDMVRIPRAAERARDYPHQLSGGQIQRVMIAAALSCQPSLLIADEPTTALDVTVQGRILDLLSDLQTEFGMGVLFVTHDLGVVADICDRVVVMYAGQIVEDDSVERLFARPSHPYTEGLLHTLPRPGGGRLANIPGRVPPPELWPVDRCRFLPRCPYAVPACEAGMPPLQHFEGGSARCVRAEERLREVGVGL